MEQVRGGGREEGGRGALFDPFPLVFHPIQGIVPRLLCAGETGKKGEEERGKREHGTHDHLHSLEEKRKKGFGKSLRRLIYEERRQRRVSSFFPFSSCPSTNPKLPDPSSISGSRDHLGRRKKKGCGHPTPCHFPLRLTPHCTVMFEGTAVCVDE